MTHHKEIIDNCRRLHKAGPKKHAGQEEKRWLCPECKQPLSWYDKACKKCGASRSEKVFKLEYNWPPE
jgi:predicted amidophosphoribosyltransferase